MITITPEMFAVCQGWCRTLQLLSKNDPEPEPVVEVALHAVMAGHNECNLPHSGRQAGMLGLCLIEFMRQMHAYCETYHLPFDEIIHAVSHSMKGSFGDDFRIVLEEHKQPADTIKPAISLPSLFEGQAPQQQAAPTASDRDVDARVQASIQAAEARAQSASQNLLPTVPQTAGNEVPPSVSYGAPSNIPPFDPKPTK